MCRCEAELLLECSSEMRSVFETDIKTDIRNLFASFLYFLICYIQSFLHNPFLGRQVAYLLEISLESGKATACV